MSSKQRFCRIKNIIVQNSKHNKLPKQQTKRLNKTYDLVCVVKFNWIKHKVYKQIKKQI